MALPFGEGGRTIVRSGEVFASSVCPSGIHLEVNCPNGARDTTLGCPQRGRLFICEIICLDGKLHLLVQLFLFIPVRMKGREAMDRKTGEKELRERIRSGKVSRADVTRRLAELAFGKANDCVRLALEDDPQLGKLDLSLLSEVKRNDKGTVEIKLIDRLRALEQLAAVAGEESEDLEVFLQALGGEKP